MQELSPSSPPALKKLPRALLPFLAPNRIDVKEFVLMNHVNSVPISRTVPENLRKSGSSNQPPDPSPIRLSMG
jgi:hypothetical protein